MPFCAACGTRLSDNAKFCQKCGNPTLIGPDVVSRTAQLRDSVSQGSCRYHPDAFVAGTCVDCNAEFCQECAVEIVRHGTVCLKCGARFARRKLIQACVAAVLGLFLGVIIAFQAASENNWAFAIAAPLIYTYFFPAVFFGWHYGGRIWKTLSSISDHFTGFSGLIATLFLLSFRTMVAIFLGAFGGGIAQYLNYRNIIKSYQRVSIPSMAAAA